MGVYQVSCGPIPMNIGGNRPGAFPELPIQPRNLDLSRKTQFKALDFFFRRTKHIRDFFILLTTVLIISFVAIFGGPLGGLKKSRRPLGTIRMGPHGAD